MQTFKVHKFHMNFYWCMVGDGVDNIGENSSIFSLMRIH